MKKIIQYIFALPLCVLFILLQRITSPLFLIRISSIDTSRIGWFHTIHWHFQLESSPNTLDLFYDNRTALHRANELLVKNWRKKFIILPFKRPFYLAEMFNRKLRADKYIVPLQSMITLTSPHSVQGVIDFKSNDLFYLTPDQESIGNKELKEIGVNKPYVCFHNRDSAYLNKSNPNKDWSYHDHRDSDIQLYKSAILFLIDEGYDCIRMGSEISQEFRLSGVEGVFDYGGTHRQSSLMDIYLAKNCEIFITGDTGLNIYPSLFKKPSILLNWVSIANIFRFFENSIFLPKLYYNLAENRLMTFNEMLSEPLTSIYSNQQLESQNLQIRENSEEEILEAIIEQTYRMRGIWKEQREDLILQQQFWSLYGKHSNRCQTFRIGAKFLRKYRHLL